MIHPARDRGALTDMGAAADARRLVLLALAILVGRLGLDRALGLELHFDEAQYWEWSQRLDWSYWPRRLPVYVVGDPFRRRNQHDIWPGPAREVGRTGLFVSTGGPPPELARAFARCQVVPPVIGVARNGAPVRTLVAHLCEDYRPIDWPAPRRY